MDKDKVFLINWQVKKQVRQRIRPDRCTTSTYAFSLLLYTCQVVPYYSLPKSLLDLFRQLCFRHRSKPTINFGGAAGLQVLYIGWHIL
jgi:hypothetical protein